MPTFDGPKDAHWLSFTKMVLEECDAYLSLTHDQVRFLAAALEAEIEREVAEQTSRS